jgi:Ca2+-binding EF-hand superfamily protein
LTTKGDLESKIDYTFRIYDRNGDNQISGEEIKKMANVREDLKMNFEKKFLFYCRQF